MGHVWVADHLGLNTQVVVKFISEALSADPGALARFSREAAAAALVRSPHVVHMLDHGVLPGNLPYIAMELLEGEDLSQRLVAEHVLPPRQMATILSQVAKALMRAQECGVVHRDIKPDNIFLSDGGGGEAFVKVLDFGIAKVGDPNLSHTRTGSVVGTPYYMSPEQTTGSRTVDHRTDVWSLGVVAFEALTGKRPFEGGTVGGLAVKICHGPMPKPSEVAPSLPPALDDWFLKACAREVEARFATAQELAAAFGSAVGGSEAVAFVRRREGAVDSFDRTSARVRAEIASAPTVQQQSPEQQSPGAYSVEASGAVVTPHTGSSVMSEPVAGLRPRARWPRLLALPAVAIVAVVGFMTLASRSGTAPQPAGGGLQSAAPLPPPVASPIALTAPPADLQPSSQPSATVAPSSAPRVGATASGAPAARSPAPIAGRAAPGRATSASPSTAAAPAAPAAALPVPAADPFGAGRK
jgi:serine/threonine protein kinase